MVACHTDDDATNNRLENLRWDTSSANAHDRVRNQRDANARKTHCANGHEYTAENTMSSPQPHGWNARRSCRICKREAWHRWNASKAW